MNDTGLEQSFTELRLGYADEPYPELPRRLNALQRVRSLLLENEPALCEALSDDYGYRSAHQSSFAEITTTVKSANHAIKNLKFWMQPERRNTDLSLRMSGARSFTQAIPKGVVGIISPWNFPINLTLSPLVSVLAAGNRALIKPSEITPATSSLIAELIAQYFQPTEVAVVCGGVELAQTFIRLPFDHLIYTGGAAIAREIMRAAADNLVPLTLELGGKSPVVVSDSANLNVVAKRVAFGKYFNAGQICIAPDYLMIGSDKLEEFLLLLMNAVHKADANTGSNTRDSVAIINEHHRQRLQNMVNQAEELGARIIHMGLKNSPYQLFVVIDPPEGSLINQQEIFGPVLTVKTVNCFEDQITYIRKQPNPLVIYYFGNNKDEFEQLSTQTRSGSLVKNDIIFQYANDDLPFGGVGSSGMGKYRGIDGFKEFSHNCAIFKSGFIDVSGLVTPPYPSWFKVVNNIMRKL
ncbi:MAG: aldehyde dehydrogenase family protein [Pseudomonadales bacterium]|nr:aldehyde dehydrogenase family protein [Pseudomonadales bacterium]